MTEEKDTLLEDSPDTETVDEIVDETVDEGLEENDPEEEEAEDEPLNPDEIDIETRTETPKPKKVKDDDDIDPADEESISKIVERKTAPLTQRMQDQQDTIEVDGFIQSKPEFAKYRAVVLKYIKSPAYSNIPVHNIMAMVSAKDQQRIGAKIEREAQEKAKATKNPGNTTRKTGSSEIDWSKATPQEIADKKAEIMEKGRLWNK